MVRRWRSNRSGFTLIELCVVLAIIAIVTGLLIAAVGKVREASVRLTCANNLHNIGMALHMHENRYRLFPSNGGWDGKQTIKTTSGGTTTVWVHEKHLGLKFTYGVGEPNRDPHAQTGSWAYAILRFLDQENIERQREWAAPVGLYACPARRPAVVMPAVNDANGTYQGGGWNWAHIDYGGNAQVIPNRPRCLAVRDITDGLSHTILVGEKAMQPALYSSGAWYWDEPYFVGGSGGTQRGFGTRAGEGLQIIRDSTDMGYAYRYNWGSAHPRGAHFLFADAGVRLLAHGTNPSVVQALLTPAGKERVPDEF